MSETTQGGWFGRLQWRNPVHRHAALWPALAGLFHIVRLLPEVSLPLTASVTVGVLAGAVLPFGFTLATGALVGAVPQAIGNGFDSPDGRLALQALTVLALLG